MQQPTKRIDPEVRVYDAKFSDVIAGIKNMLGSYQHSIDIQQHIEGGVTTETKVIITLRK